MTRHRFLSMIGGLAILVAIFLLYRVFRNQDLMALMQAIASVPMSTLAIAGAFTVGSFIMIVVLEFLAVLYTHTAIPVRRIGATAFAAVAIGHTIGLSALSSGAIRYRMYSRAGLGILSVGKILVFCGLSAASGLAGIGGISLLWQADGLAPVLRISPEMVRGVGITILAVLFGYFALCVGSRSHVFAFGEKFKILIPKGSIAAAQIIAANTNVLCIAGALYACLRGYTDVTYPMVAALYVSSDLTALLGHVPGGWGVLEYIVTASLGSGQVLAGVLLFRAIYYLLPFILGLIVFLSDEIIARRKLDAEISSSHPVTNAT